MYAIRSYYDADIVVDAQGTGEYKTITEAINALPMYQYQRTVVYIKNGIYEEHLRIDQNYITLKGESKDVITTYSIHYTKLYELDAHQTLTSSAINTSNSKPFWIMR